MQRRLTRPVSPRGTGAGTNPRAYDIFSLRGLLGLSAVCEEAGGGRGVGDRGTRAALSAEPTCGSGGAGLWTSTVEHCVGGPT